MAIQLGDFVQMADKIKREALKHTDYALELCKYLHQNPELSFCEFETAKRMAGELRKLDFEVTENVGGNSVVGVFRNGKGPIVMLRTDMDALPIEEKTGLPFASTKTSSLNGNDVAVMHACGHDIHMSTWAGTARTLVALKDEWKGTLLFIAQQAEEYSGGAGEALDWGLYTKFPVPDCVLAYHINPEIETGQVGLAGGYVFAGVKTVEITVYGKGGHGAYPHKCINPILISSRIVTELQSIVSRELRTDEPAVISVGSIHGGTRPNIIPDEVKMELTLRYFSEQTIKKIINSIKRISKNAALAAGLSHENFPRVFVSPVETPPVLNNHELSKQLHGFASGIISTKKILKTSPEMVSEDFGKYGLTKENVPICLIWLGSTNPSEMKQLEKEGKKPFSLHSPMLKPDYKKTIETGIAIMTGNIIGLLNQ